MQVKVFQIVPTRCDAVLDGYPDGYPCSPVAVII
jgi:hypothetical protein